MDIEKIMDAPYYIIDILPKRVSDEKSISYSKIERYYLAEPRITELRKKQAEAIIKLTCYYDIHISTDCGDSFEEVAGPDIIDKHFATCVGVNSLYIKIQSPDCFITLDGCDTYMTVYTSDSEVHELLEKLAGSVGLFLWKA
jgi:hypothetical protein